MRVRLTAPFLSLGFLAVLALMAGVSVVALSVLDDSVKRTDTIVHQYNQKLILVNRMHTAARERILSLNKMVVWDDPFEMDQEWLRFNSKGTEFVVSRNELLRLGLTREEENLLERQRVITSELGPLQNQMAQLIIDGETGPASDLLVNQAIPLQNEAFELFNRFRRMQEDAANEAWKDSQGQYEEAYTLIVMVATSMVVLGLAIGGVVVRRTAETEDRLRKERGRALVTLYSIGDGVITTDNEGCVEQINEVAQRLTGWTARRAEGMAIERIFRVLKESDHQRVPNPVMQTVSTGRSFKSEGDMLLWREDKKEYAIEYTVSPIRDERDGQSGAILVFKDVTEMRALSRQLSYHASHDSLTGLNNRREFESTLERSLAEVRRHKDFQHWLCYIDLDQFKVVNDTCGHVAGDELLKQISNTLKQQVRDLDLVARMGGDEFAILITHCGETNAVDVVERIRKSVQEMRFNWDNKSFSTSASIGLVPLDRDSGSVNDLLSAADTACYVSKEEGRNRVHLYRAGDDATVKREGEMEMVHRINKALEENRFQLYAQRIMPLQAPEQELHAEILVRMFDEEGQMVSPMAFIPAAERYNLMSQVDRWVVKRAVERLAEHTAAGLSLRFSVNLSAQSLSDDDFRTYVLGVLESSGANAAHLCFEITETAAIANLTRAVAFIEELKELGCRISLDDFGSGLSSFGYLKNMPVDYLKIDGGFIQDILDDPMDRAFVESINQIGHVIGVATIAEFVDQPEKLELLRAIGIDYGQGFYIQRPMPLSDLLSSLSDAA